MKAFGKIGLARLAIFGGAFLSGAANATLDRMPELICGIENTEDLVALPHSRWLIGSGMGDGEFQNGGLFLIDTHANKAVKVPLHFSPEMKAEAPYDQCPAPPTAAFSSQGLGIRENRDGTSTLYAVSHGGRQAIEVFRISTRGKMPQVDWIGCIIAPPQTNINSVAPRSDDSVVVSAPISGELPVVQTPQGLRLREGIKADELMGATFLWTRAAGWQEIPGGRLRLNNGVVLSRDEQWAFVASWPQNSVTYLPLDPSRGPARTIALTFHPDNLRWTADGKITAAGHVGATLEEVNACNQGNNPHCGIDYRVAEINPRTLVATPLYEGKGTYDFGMTTTALKTRDALWLAAARSTCVGKVKPRE